MDVLVNFNTSFGFNVLSLEITPWMGVLSFIIFKPVRNGCFQSSLILMPYHFEIKFQRDPDDVLIFYRIFIYIVHKVLLIKTLRSLLAACIKIQLASFYKMLISL